MVAKPSFTKNGATSGLPVTRPGPAGKRQSVRTVLGYFWFATILRGAVVKADEQTNSGLRSGRKRELSLLCFGRALIRKGRRKPLSD